MESILDGELWKDVPGWDGVYQVSSLGRIRSTLHTVRYNDGRVAKFPGKVLKLTKNQDGYLCAVIRQRGTGRVISYKIHRVVAEVFVANPHGYTEVNHIDEDKTNNNAANLEWCDRLKNCNHGTRNERISAANSRPIILTKPGEPTRTMPSQTEAARWLGVRTQSVAYAIRHKTRCRGYRCQRCAD